MFYNGLIQDELPFGLLEANRVATASIAISTGTAVKLSQGFCVCFSSLLHIDHGYRR